MSWLRTVGAYTARILKDGNPPIRLAQLAMKVELIINLKTAKALSIMSPLTHRAPTDEVIE